MTTGLLGELAGLTNAWTTGSTWWVFSAATGIALACILLRAAAFARRLAADRDPERWLGLLIGVALFGAALALRLLVPERVHYTFNDEYEYLDYARRLLATGEYRLWTGPPAGVYLYAVAFALFGVSNEVAFLTTIVLASVTPPILYWLLRLLRVDRQVATVAALLLVLAPLHVKHAASASLEVQSLLFLLLALGTLLELLRDRTALAAACFAVSLFAALSVRIENWLVLVLAVLLAWPWRAQLRRLRATHILAAGVAVVLAAAYVPGILDAPIRYDLWWKSRLGGASLLLTNLGFWAGGDPGARKLPLLLAFVGLVSGLRRSPRATLLWIAFLLLFSIVFVLYGLNIGWLEEVHQPPPWGARAAGHDMFRFDVILLPAVVFLLASGLVAVARAAAALLRGTGAVAAWSRSVRLLVLGGAAAAVVLLLLWHGEYASYHPLAFVASPYNRSFEIAEFRFVRDAVALRRPGSVLYVLPPSDGIVVGEVAVRPLAALDADRAAAAPAAAFVYVNGRQLVRDELKRKILDLQGRYLLREVDRRVAGGEHFYLFAVVPRRPAGVPDGARSDLSTPGIGRQRFLG